jgi:peptidoglycan-N-acetylglucosamine deacetylase
MKQQKPIASLSLDLDNQWSYMKTHGDPGWEIFPSYLDVVVPRILSLLREQGLTITFFIVGQDAALQKNQDAIRMIAEAGHEIGNHSFCHEPWLHQYTEEQIDQDLSMTEELLTQLTGQKPIGFRGPGYSLSKTALKVLARRGYIYDASTLPTYIGPLARMYFFMTSRFSIDEKEKRDLLFGSLGDGLRPLKPYRWSIDGNGEPGEGSIEIPVTTMPIFKVPFHVSYLLYLRSYTKILALFYFKFALLLCRLTGTHPSLLLHPLDFLGCEDVNELSFFPAMDMASKEKLRFVSEILQIYHSHYEVTPLKIHANLISQMPQLSIIKPHFRSEQSYQ